jgi:hypothetical protein
VAPLVIVVVPIVTALAVAVIVPQPNPVFVVQISACPADEQLPTACAVGEAAPAVAFTRTVLAACVARSARVINPVAVKELVTVRPARVPTEVSDEVTTLLASVVPVSVPAGAITTLPAAAVSWPSALTVKLGIDVDEP